MRIEVKDLGFRYSRKGTDVLSGLSVSFEGNGSHILLGLNGSGKTTLIRLLAGLEKHYKGEIRYGGKDLKKCAVGERARIFAYVPQHPACIPGLTVSEYLEFSTANQLKWFEHPGEASRRRVNEEAERLNIGYLLNRDMGEISGGERQIVFVAAALVQNTPVLLLDEPTSALDLPNQERVLSVLRIAANEKTVILSDHDPNHALRLGAEVLLLKDGRIIDRGPSSEVVTPERMKPVYGDGICFSADHPYREISFRSAEELR